MLLPGKQFSEFREGISFGGGLGGGEGREIRRGVDRDGMDRDGVSKEGGRGGEER